LYPHGNEFLFDRFADGNGGAGFCSKGVEKYKRNCKQFHDSDLLTNAGDGEVVLMELT
jgi:hypothetical protein